jgi:hypothetical protein
MNNKARLEKLTEALKSTFDSRMTEDVQAEEIRFALPSLRKIARSKVEIKAAVEAVKNESEIGTDGPLIALGLKKAPTHRVVWMPNVSLAREEIA